MNYADAPIPDYDEYLDYSSLKQMDAEGYIYWPGPHDEHTMFIYRAKPDRWDSGWLALKAWMHGLPIDLDIPYV